MGWQIVWLKPFRIDYINSECVCLWTNSIIVFYLIHNAKMWPRDIQINAAAAAASIKSLPPSLAPFYSGEYWLEVLQDVCGRNGY